MKKSTVKKTRNVGKRGQVLSGVIVGVVISVSILCALIYILIARGFGKKSTPDQSLLHDCPSVTEDLPQDLQFEDIMRATEDPNDKYVIGRGKDGTVYRTESANSRKHWAVKKVDLSKTSFVIETKTLSLIRHRNVVRMAGYCMKDGYGYIVTEYVPGGTLFDALHRSEPQLVLGWDTRYRIAFGIAQGLSYLHHDCVPQVIHRDIKSDNILLDSQLEPKIGDFGIAKLVNDSDSSSTRSAIVGTLGYIAPENAYSTRLTEKCDVYSYGVILLELLCRRLPVDPCFEEGLDIVSWSKKKLQENDEFIGFFDEEICYWDRDEQQKALKLLDLALECTEQVADARPSMRDVVAFLIKLNDKHATSLSNRRSSRL
ncbi:leucine-rich repeat receptor-like protein kinase PEPR2 [Juglans microcarpa x Juglans regia]|uniref:leucine-rich repeat receptor-like protein kinase PEPR2 n=1 Tax=Juglans microcarpa x Juglans regia TaxID=2249226 RepID=UPI001B7E817E|nr:leucine-rich repeat receptor-like protein kinase PEPR2 [Juglans microcarpa x Juglans regia]